MPVPSYLSRKNPPKSLFEQAQQTNTVFAAPLKKLSTVAPTQVSKAPPIQQAPLPIQQAPLPISTPRTPPAPLDFGIGTKTSTPMGPITNTPPTGVFSRAKELSQQSAPIIQQTIEYASTPKKPEASGFVKNVWAGIKGHAVSSLAGFTGAQIHEVVALNNKKGLASMFDTGTIPSPTKIIPKPIRNIFFQKAVAPTLTKIADDLLSVAEEQKMTNPNYDRPEYFDDTPGLDGVINNLKNYPSEYTGRLIGENLPLFGAQIGVAYATRGKSVQTQARVAAPTLIPRIARALVAPLQKSGFASFAYMGLGSGGETLLEAREAGASEEAALNASIARGLTEGYLENLGLERIFTKKGVSTLSNSFSKNLVTKARDIGGAAMAEMSTEGAQQFMANVIALTYDENRDLFEGVAESMLAGGLLGGGANAALNIKDSVQKNGISAGMSIKDVSKENTDLIEEAKKYKSAEEFVKAQEDKLFIHGTQKKIDGNLELKSKAGGVQTPEKDAVDVLYVTPNTDTGKMHSRMYTKQNGVIYAIKLKPEAKIFDYTNPAHRKMIEKTMTESQKRLVNDNLVDGQLSWMATPPVKNVKKLGFDGMKQIERKAGEDAYSATFGDAKYSENAESLMLFNKNVFEQVDQVKNKSQLTDIWNKANKVEDTKPAFSKNLEVVPKLSTKIVEALKGKDTVSKQYISDLTNSGDVKQVERELIRQVLETMPDGKVNINEFAKKVYNELLPLTTKSSKITDTQDPDYDEYFDGGDTKYESVSLPSELRGNVKDYIENIYESPIKTLAGNVHFGDDAPNYFGHTRIEDMADDQTRRVIEVQSDLYQKGRLGENNPQLKKELIDEYTDLKKEDGQWRYRLNKKERDYKLESLSKKMSEVDNYKKLSQYNDPTAHFRMIREEVKKAAEDGKTKLQFPTGETAMKIEGLGRLDVWYEKGTEDAPLKKENLKVGEEVTQGSYGGAEDVGQELSGTQNWIITDVLGDGKFKAVKKGVMDEMKVKYDGTQGDLDKNLIRSWEEEFDISGKVDTNNPIYKFYEKEVGRYLKNKYKAELVTDENGVKWWELNVKPEESTKPVEAFSRPDNLDKEMVPGNKALDDAREIQKRLKLSNIDNEIVDYILDDEGGRAFAVAMGNKALFTNEVPRFTGLHETIHIIHEHVDQIKLFQKAGITKAKLDNALRAISGDEDIREILAENGELRAQYKAQLQKRSVLDRFLNIINQWLKRIFSPKNQNIINKFLDIVETGKAKEETVLPDLKKRLNIRYSRKGEKVVSFQKENPAYSKPNISEEERSKIILPSKEVRPKVDPLKFLELVQRTNEIFAEYKKKGGLEIAAEEIERRKNRLKALNKDVVQGIKNSSYFQKEKSIIDNMGESYLLEKDGTFIIPEKSKVDEYILKGYRKVMEIDSLAQQAGFENGLDFLEDQLAMSKISKSQNKAQIAKEYLQKENDEYRKLIRQIRMDMENISYETKVLHLEKGRRLQLINRRGKIQALRDYFNLSDEELKSISRKDPRLMGEKEFHDFLLAFERKASEYMETRQAKIELTEYILAKDFKNTENLRKAMKLPMIDEMTMDQMAEFEEVLSQYKMHDSFLSQRLLETVDNTELSGKKTFREVYDAMAEKIGTTVPELLETKFRWGWKFLYDTALSRQNNLMRFMVEQWNKFNLQSLKASMDRVSEVNELAKKARKSRRSSIGNKLVPTDEVAFNYIESPDKRAYVEQYKMTKEELDYANYIIQDMARIRDILIQKDQLSKHSRFLDNNYITHIQRPFLEAIKNKEFKSAFEELFTKEAKQEAVFRIVDETGSILSYEKFFPYALSRTGGIKPTQNLARAYTTYMKAFEKKNALDAVIPEIMAYATILTPEEQTQTGLQKDRTLETFVKLWLNNKKGRKANLTFMAQGDRLDNIMRGLNVFLSLKDLGWNPFSGSISAIGENLTNFAQLRQRMFLGKGRGLTKKGRAIAKKYKNFLGDTPFESIFLDASKHVGEKMMSSAFTLFHKFSYNANRDFLLGSMTKEEFEKGEISLERLAALQNKMGRYRVVDGAKSIIGATSFGEAIMKYRGWAVPTLMTTLNNFKKVATGLKTKKLDKEAAAELLVVAVETFAVFLLVNALLDEDNETVPAKVAQKIKNESMSLISSLDPRMWARPARVIQYADDLANAIVELITLEKYANKEGYKGVNGIIKSLLPSVAANRIIGEDEKISYKRKRKELIDSYKTLIKDKTMSEEAAAKNLEKDLKALNKKTIDELKKEIPKMEWEESVKEVKSLLDNKGIEPDEAVKLLTKQYNDLEKKKKAQSEEFELIQRAKEKGLYVQSDQESFLDTVVRGAKAFGVDPKTAFKAMFTDESIQLVNSTRVGLKRMALEDSEAFKEKFGSKDKDYKLEHIVPIAIGGTNSKSNLQIVTTETWKEFTKADLLIINAVDNKLLSPSEGRGLIKRYKNGEITFDELGQMLQIQ